MSRRRVLKRAAMINQHIVPLIDFLRVQRKLSIYDGAIVLLVATGHIIGEIQSDQPEAQADVALEAFLDVIRQAARLARHEAKRPHGAS